MMEHKMTFARGALWHFTTSGLIDADQVGKNICMV